MKFIHTGDLHLDSPFQGLSEDFPKNLWKQVHHSTFLAWQRIVDLALKEQVDFVVVVGDIFDRDQHGVAAEDFFVQQCQRLDQADIPVYLSYGNHDYQDVDADPLMLPGNVHVFDNHIETKMLSLADHRQVALTGFSYGSRWIHDDQVNLYPRRGAADFQIGLLHGAIAQSDNNNYAPFTVAELVNKNYDYWALGHIHKHQELNQQPPIVYCGDPQGRHINEDGEHGCYLVQEEHGRLVPTFKPISSIIWQTIKLHLPTTAKSLADIRVAVAQAVTSKITSNQLNLVRLILTADDQQQIDSDRLLEYLRHDCQHQQPVQWWPLDMTISQPEQLPTITDTDRQYWQQAAGDVFTMDQVQQLLDEYKMSRYGFLADQVDDDLVRQLRRQAMRLLEQEGDNENPEN